jgi:hypothetical protein
MFRINSDKPNTRIALSPILLGMFKVNSSILIVICLHQDSKTQIRCKITINSLISQTILNSKSFLTRIIFKDPTQTQPVFSKTSLTLLGHFNINMHKVLSHITQSLRYQYLTLFKISED